MPDETYGGGCLCGAVRFVASGRPDAVAACHCQSCRRHTGAPFAVYADYPVERVAWSGAPRAEYRSSARAHRGFCGRCGATLSFRGDDLPRMIHLHVGAFDRPELFASERDERLEERVAWAAPVAPTRGPA